MRDQFVIDLFAQFRRELFGIIQTTMTEFFRKNDSRSDNGTRQRAAASFVNPGEARDSDGAKFFLVTKSAAPIHQRESSTHRVDFPLKIDVAPQYRVRSHM